MCIKKCSCCGIVNNYKGNTYADICPKGKLNKSFVTFPNLFRSVKVEQPKCLSIGSTDYLTVGGTGMLNVRGKEVEGVYTLIMADSGSKSGRFAFEFLSSGSYGYPVALFVSFAADVKVCKCKHCKKKTKEHQTDKSGQPVKAPMDLSYFGNYAKMVIFHPNGMVEEEDLISCSFYK